MKPGNAGRVGQVRLRAMVPPNHVDSQNDYLELETLADEYTKKLA
jgi:hypothetical protein